MGSLRDIKRHIKSVQNTAQITKAMEMVASSKMRKAQQAALNGRPYAYFLNRMLVSVRNHVDSSMDPLLAQRPVTRTLVILLSTDRGLCGGLNSNLFREMRRFDKATTDFISIGRKGTQALTRGGWNIIAEFPLQENPTAAAMRTVSKFARERFVSGKCDSVEVLFPAFVNTLEQKPRVMPLLPITDFVDAGFILPGDNVPPTVNSTTELLIEPHPHKVLDVLLPFYVDFLLFQMTLGTRASEHSARMVAMKSANDSAEGIIKELTISYNKVRQDKITTEILEIATAQLAMD